MSPDELPDFLAAIRDRAAKAAPDAAMAMASRYHGHLSGVTLRRTAHPPATKTPSSPGEPPAWMTGRLAGSVTSELVWSSGTFASAAVGPNTIYARIQALGGDIYPVRARYLRWVEDGVVHFSRHVYLPPRPYMEPALRDCIADGSLRRDAAAAFMARVWG